MRRHHVTAIVLLALALFWLYGGIVARLAAQWGSDDNYAHGFLVVPFAVFVAWTRRDALRSAPVRPGLAGLALLSIGLLILVAGKLGAELFLTRLSLILVLAGAIGFVWGRVYLRVLALPLASLLFMIPLPAIVFNQITFPLQLVASTIGEGLIRGVGIPVLREGNVLQLPSRTLEVAEACSGVRSLGSLMMLALVLGYFTERRVGRRVLLALTAIPLSIAANAIRVAGTGIASEWISPAVAEGFLHTFSGLVMFSLAALGLAAVQHAAASIGPRLARRPVLEGRS